MVGRALELRQQVVRTLDRAGHQLREERDKRQEPHETALGLDDALVSVDRVAHRLERVKRDADGQDDLREEPVFRNAHQREQGIGIRDRVGQPCREAEVFQTQIDVFRDESGILEIAEEAKIADQADDEPERAAPAAHVPSRGP